MAHNWERSYRAGELLLFKCFAAMPFSPCAYDAGLQIVVEAVESDSPIFLCVAREKIDLQRPPYLVPEAVVPQGYWIEFLCLDGEPQPTS